MSGIVTGKKSKKSDILNDNPDTKIVSQPAGAVLAREYIVVKRIDVEHCVELILETKSIGKRLLQEFKILTPGIHHSNLSEWKKMVIDQIRGIQI